MSSFCILLLPVFGCLGCGVFYSGNSTGGTGNTGGALAFAPSSVTFAAVSPGTTSPSETATLTNTGSGPVTLQTVSLSGSFTQSNNCPVNSGSLAAGASCTFTVASQPSSAGSYAGTVTVQDTAGQSAQLSLSGAGSTPGNGGGNPPSGGGGNPPSGGSGTVSLSPTSYSFPSQAAGTSGSPQAFTLANGESTTITISNIATSNANFTETNDCGSSLAAGASCTIMVEFTPQSSGSLSGTLSVTDSGSSSPLMASLTGISGTSGNSFTINPKNISFSPQLLGRPSSPLSVAVTNNTSAAVTISSITSTGAPFTVTNTCLPSGGGSGTLNPGSSCSITVTFDPTQAITYSGSITVTNSAAGSPETIPLLGTGEAGDTVPSLVITPQASCILPSGTQQFATQAKNTNNTAVTWYVNGVANGNSSVGTISTSGLYAAPATTGTRTVKAVDTADNISASTSIDVTTTPIFSINPYSASIPVNGQQTFQAQMCGVPDNNVTFSVDNIAGGNATVGTITSNGVYTAPNTAGKHTVRVTDTTLDKTTGAVVTVFSGMAVDFGSRTNTQYPIRAGILGVNHVDDLHTVADIGLVAQAGITLTRTYALMETVYATQTPDWTKIDPLIANVQSQGMHVLMEMAYTPPWLQPNPNSCGAGDAQVAPTDINAWAQLAASYVAHMDATFPGVVTDYEIWNEPDTHDLCGSNDRLTTYLSMYAAAAPLMKQQAAADGATIRVGGPVTSGMNPTWIPALISNSSTAPYVDFVSYHNYLAGTSSVDMTWDTYNGNTPLYQLTQQPSGVAGTYAHAAELVAAGTQPGGASTPIYVTEYNTDFAYAQNCCQNDPTYAPVWNALYVSDVLDTVYSGTANVPGQLAYFAANIYPYFCLIGTWDTNMDCQYDYGTTPEPYPQYYAYQLMASPGYLGMNSGGYMAASVSPPPEEGGLAMTAFYTPKQDSILIVNPTSTDDSQMSISVQNTGFSSPSATLYQIVNGQSIGSSSVTLTPDGSGGYTITISVPAYTVMGISIQ